MHIDLIRYHETPQETKSRLLLDGQPLGEARETGTSSVSAPRRLAEGTYRCRPVSSPLSPMTLQVRRPVGFHRMLIGWHPLRQHLASHILVGQAHPHLLPEVRPLHGQQETFLRLTRRVYQAYAQGEDITLTVGHEAP